MTAGLLSPTSPEVVELVAALQENRDLPKPHGPSGHRLVVVQRRKYLAIDEVPTFEGRDCPGQSGRFLVDRASGEVFTIQGYGQRGHRVGTVAGLTEQFRAASATFDHEAGAYWKNRAGMASTDRR